MNYNEIINELYNRQDPVKALFKREKYNITAENVLGVYQKDLTTLSKEIGKDSNLAIRLFDSGIYEGRLLCSTVFNKNDLTSSLMEQWVKTFENWEICDSFCMKLFSRTPFAREKIEQWTLRDEEFVKRSGFVIMASYCMADKQASNNIYEDFLPRIKQESHDQRLYVKKAVNWALRSIGKRNQDLRKLALSMSEELIKMECASAQWIGKDALKELSSESVKVLDYPRTIYRNH